MIPKQADLQKFLKNADLIDTARRYLARDHAGYVDDLVSVSVWKFYRYMLKDPSVPPTDWLKYLKGMVRNEALQFLRTKKRRRGLTGPVFSIDDDRDGAVGDVEGGEASPLPGPDEMVEARDLLTQCLAPLPQRDQTILWLREVEGLTAPEIGPRVGLNPSSVGQELVRIKKRLDRVVSQLEPATAAA